MIGKEPPDVGPGSSCSWGNGFFHTKYTPRPTFPLKVVAGCFVGTQVYFMWFLQTEFLSYPRAEVPHYFLGLPGPPPSQLRRFMKKAHTSGRILLRSGLLILICPLRV